VLEDPCSQQAAGSRALLLPRDGMRYAHAHAESVLQSLHKSTRAKTQTLLRTDRQTDRRTDIVKHGKSCFGTEASLGLRMRMRMRMRRYSHATSLIQRKSPVIFEKERHPKR
jgi:hypothetical protein